MRITSRFLLFCFAWIILLEGCSETVSPYVGEERPFTVYGYLDPTTDAQIIRVIPIVGNINDVGLLDVDATVRTINQETDEVTVWQKAITLFSDSTEGVVFTANFTPQYNSKYRLEVNNAEGELITAETVVPELIIIERLDGGNPFRPGFFIQGDDPNLIQIVMNYIAVAKQPSFSGLSDVVIPLSVSYKGEEEPSSDGLELRANLLADKDLVFAAMSEVCLITPFITIRSAELEFFVGDDNWVPPGGEFDAATLVQPGVFSNIENGYGYFGSGYSINFSIRLTSSLLEQVGYVVLQPCDANFVTPDLTLPECQELIACIE